MPQTIDEENEVERERVRTKLRDRSRIFKEVFGTWNQRTKHGDIILGALLEKFGHTLPPNVLDNQGRTDEYQTWRRLGHFDVLEYLKTQLEWNDVNPSSSSPK